MMPDPAELRRMFEQSTIIRKGVKVTGASPVRVRSLTSPDGILCCFGPCDQLGDDRIHVDVPHEAPRYPGEPLRYIYCSDKHRAYHVAGTPLARVFR